MGEFNSRLQSLRGVAALMVAVGHALLIFPNGQGFDMRPGSALLAAASLVFQPNTAVIFFYVLSGYVLGRSLHRRPGFLAFLVRRVGRLWPMMLGSILAAAVVFTLLRGAHVPGQSPWLAGHFQVSVTAADLLANLSGWRAHEINGVMWSIQVEAVMALLLPGMVWIAARTHMGIDLAIFAALAWLCVRFFDALPLAWGPYYAVLYSFAFYLGVAIPKVLAVRSLASTPALLASLGLLLGVEVGFHAHWYGIAAKYVLNSLASAQIIVFVLRRPETPFSRWLDTGPLRKLGDISYSFYAVGLFTMVALAWVAARLLPPAAVPVSDLYAMALTGAVALFTVALSATIALASYRWIELPGVGWGQRMSHRIEARRALQLAPERR